MHFSHLTASDWGFAELARAATAHTEIYTTIAFSGSCIYLVNLIDSFPESFGSPPRSSSLRKPLEGSATYRIGK